MDEIQALIPILDKNEKCKEDTPLLVSLGKGYRNLIGRFLTGKPFSTNQSIEDDCDYEHARKMSALLWKPDEWLCD